jgi:hypothetical protein
VAARVGRRNRGRVRGLGEDEQGWGLGEDAREWGLGDAAYQIPPALTDVRARKKVGPTCSRMRVKNDHCMGLASERRAKINDSDAAYGEIGRSRIENRCETSYGGHLLYL